MENEGHSASGARSLVLFPGALGDAVCLEPVVAWLAAAGPVEVVARGAAAEVSRLFPSRPQVSSLDRVEVARLFGPREDEGVGDDWLDAYARIVSFTGARSPELRARLEGRERALLVPFPSREGSTHAIDEMLSAVVGAEAPERAAPVLSLPQSSPGAPGRMLLQPGAGSPGKRAPRRVLRAIARRWCGSGGRSVEVVLGPAESGEDEAWCDLGVVVRPSTVEELARRIAAAEVYVGGDTGPSHVAAALGIRAVVLFVSTAPERFGPRGPNVRGVDLRGDVGCDPREAVWGAVSGPLP